jgi:cysteine-rich repeat protein
MSTLVPTTSPILRITRLAFTLSSCALLLSACRGDDQPADSMGSETMATGGTMGDGDGDSGDGDPGDGDPDDTTGDGDGDPGCEELGCPCSGDTCGPGLACIEDTCQPTNCGDGNVQGDEECEDGNAIDGDGCDNDCSFTRVAQVEAGIHHTCALVDGGAIVCWGRGEFGQLGYANPNNVGDDELPSDVGAVPLPSAVIKLELGGQHSCAILQDGGLRCWGLNDRGQVGNGTINNVGDDESLATLAPVSVPPVIDVEAGERHTCARVGNGEVRCWGINEQGELGYGTTMDVIPVLEMLLPGEALSLGPVTSKLAIGFWHSCVNFVDGGVRCWGRNDNGQLGHGNLENIGDNELPSSVGLVQIIPPALPPNTEVVSVALGGNHGCALLGGGELMCWGANGSGQLGYGDLNNVGDDDVPSSRVPVDIGGPAVEVTCGANHTCARRDDGEVVCWGDNSVGQLGLANTNNIGDDELPVIAGPVQLGGVAKQLSAGGNHTCALLSDGEVRCWGQNNFSQLGLGSSVTVGDNETPSEVDPVSVF